MVSNISTLLTVSLEQMLLHLPLVIGAYISFSLLKVPDLSIETAYVVGAIFGSYALTVTSAPQLVLLILVLLASFVGGSLVGLVSSMLTQKARFPHLLSSIITFGLFHGINQAISPVYVSLNSLDNPLFLIRFLPRYPELIALGLVGSLLALLIYALFKTQLGYSYAVFGNNPLFFRNYGISTSYIFITGIALANGLAGVSGYLFAQSNNFVELSMGLGKALLCITALILGKALSRKKRPLSILVPLLGAGAYFLLQQLLLKIGFNLKYFTAVQALLVLIMLFNIYRKQPRRLINDNLGV